MVPRLNSSSLPQTHSFLCDGPGSTNQARFPSRYPGLSQASVPCPNPQCSVAGMTGLPQTRRPQKPQKPTHDRTIGSISRSLAGLTVDGIWGSRFAQPIPVRFHHGEAQPSFVPTACRHVRLCSRAADQHISPPSPFATCNEYAATRDLPACECCKYSTTPANQC